MDVVAGMDVALAVGSSCTLPLATVPQIRDECGGVSSLHLCAALPCPFPSRKPNSARIRKRIINEAKQVLILPRVVRRRVLFLAGFSFGPRFPLLLFRRTRQGRRRMADEAKRYPDSLPLLTQARTWVGMLLVPARIA